MKKIMIGSALMLLSASSYASTARLLALGMTDTDNDGVYYIQDARNVFLNPAYVNVYSNLAVMEYGNAGLNITTNPNYTTASATTMWSTLAPKAQGGLFKKYENYVIGAYLGNESNTSSLLRVAGTSAASALNNFVLNTSYDSKMLQSADNQLDLFFGFENGYKYGLDLIIANGKDETRTSKDSALSLKTGMIASNWDAHFNLSLNSKSSSVDVVAPIASGALSESVTQEFRGKLGVQLGGSYNVGAHSKMFGYYKHFSWEQVDSYSKYATLHANGTAIAYGLGTTGQQGVVKGNFSSYYLGWGDQMPVNNGDNVFVSIAAKKTDINLEFTNKTQVRHLIVPVTIGYEGKATEWLTLRGSVVQNVYGQRDNQNEASVNPVAKSLLSSIYGADGKATITNSTAVNAGASLVFGNLTLDGLIGATSGDRTAASLGTGTNKGVLAFDNLLTTVGMNYKF